VIEKIFDYSIRACSLLHTDVISAYENASPLFTSKVSDKVLDDILQHSILERSKSVICRVARLLCESGRYDEGRNIAGKVDADKDLYLREQYANLGAAWFLLGEFSLSSDVIEMYASKASSKEDVYGGFALDIFWKDRNYTMLIDWLEKDHCEGNLSAPLQQYLVACYFATNRTGDAENIIAQIYNQNQTILNVQAQAAWLAWGKISDWNSLIEWYEKDLYATRLSLERYIDLAYFYAMAEDRKQAQEVLSTAYDMDPALEELMADTYTAIELKKLLSKHQ